MGFVSDRDEAQVIELLGRDVAGTLGSAHLDVVRSTARQHRQFTDDPAWYLDRVVEELPAICS
jgi:hypothetical protein